MANRVSGVETRMVRPAPGTGLQKKQDQAAGVAEGGAAAGVDVRITGAARDLAAIEQGLRELPVVDEARVAAVRQRLDEGSYRVDPQKIADRLLHVERDLDRADPVNDRTLR